MDLRQIARAIKPQILGVEDFTTYANIPNVESCIMEYRVPQGKILWLPENGIYDLRLVTKESFTLNAQAGRTSYTATLAHRIVDQPSYPMDGGDCVAYWKGSRTTVTNIDYVNGSVTATVTADSGTLDLYYIVGSGYIRWFAEPPLGLDVARILILNESLWIMHSKNHLDEKAVPRFVKHTFLPEKWMLKIYVNSPAVISWDSNAINIFARIHCNFLPKTAFTPAELSRLARS